MWSICCFVCLLECFVLLLGGLLFTILMILCVSLYLDLLGLLVVEFWFGCLWFVLIVCYLLFVCLLDVYYFRAVGLVLVGWRMLLGVFVVGLFWC